MSTVHPVGIDLGTTNSAAAYLTPAGRTEMMRNAFGDILTASVVFFDDDSVIVGRDARKAGEFNCEAVAYHAKRDLGNEFYSRSVCGRSLPPEVIQAYVLKQLRADIVQTIGEEFQVVVTVPAFFDERRRNKTLDAANMAGLVVLDIVNEPTAAALAFGEQIGYLSTSGVPKQEMNVLVYDLGGGTFDVTLIRLAPNEVRTLATDGDVHLGGYDWDRRLVDYAAQKFEDRFRMDPREDAAANARLIHACEDAKHTLSVRMQATVAVDYRGHHLDVSIARDVFEQLTADLLERTMHTTRQTISAGGITWDDVSRILLVGGSTRMPMVPQRLRAEVGIDPDTSINPDEAVARGAAVYSAHLLRQQGIAAPELSIHVVDVNSHSLGIEGIDLATGRKQNTILVPKNSPLPTSVSQRFVTKEDNQRTVVIKVLEGESPNPGACITVGKAVLRDLPAGLSKGHPIEVSYRYGSDGLLHVQSKLVGTEHQLNIQFQRDGTLENGQIQSWREIVLAEGGRQRLEQMLDEAFGIVGRPAGRSAGQPDDQAVSTSDEDTKEWT